MSFKIYNTLKKKKEIFKTSEKRVNMYTCGPTVYDYAHIGNMRAYLFYDLLKRWMKYLGYDVKHVMNLTDVDDKTIKGSKMRGISLKEYTEKYSQAFFEDLEKLKIEKADIYPKATEHINDMVEMIKLLLLKGYAYKSDDGSIYFNIKKFGDYGKLSKLKMNELKAGARVKQDEYTKEQAQDFALWKAWDENDGNVFWATSIGKGRPGWHIECSVMSKKYMKEIDIHGGGIDLVFPHHENEIAQSEAATGKQFVRYWVHCQHLLVNNQKMSKSLNNFFTLRDIIAKGYDPISFRYLCYSTHYRSQLNFTFESLENAKATVEKFGEFYSKIEWLKDRRSDVKENVKIREMLSTSKKDFESCMNDDLNTPQALAVLFDFMRKANAEIDKNNIDMKSLRYIYMFMKKVNSIFDIVEESKDKLTESELRLVEKREEFRKQKMFAEADQARAMLKEMGIVLEDTPHGVRWKKEKK